MQNSSAETGMGEGGSLPKRPIELLQAESRLDCDPLYTLEKKDLW
jgi:hypothetical protein